jgi:hypothetical protein
VASPPVQRRLGIAAVAAVLGAALTYLHARSGGRPPDFTQLWYAARAVLHGEDPYTLIGRGRAFEWQNGFFYPLPAAILATPFAGLADRRRRAAARRVVRDATRLGRRVA